MLIRREGPADLAAIDEVHRLAFAAAAPAGGEPVEVGLVRALRADAGWIAELSLLAEDDSGRVIGHIAGSEGALDGVPVVGLGPLGVRPEHQRLAVGHALMHAFLGAADALGYPLVALLGSTAYYPRFGFVAASTLGVTSPDPTWGDHFQVRPLAAHHDGLRGNFRYAAPFEAL